MKLSTEPYFFFPFFFSVYRRGLATARAWMRGGETGAEVQRAEDDNDDDGARGREVITLKLVS